MPKAVRTLGITILLLFTIGLSACNSQTPQAQNAAQDEPAQSPVQPASTDNLNPVTGQVLYVPAYSEIFNADDQSTWDMAITLSIRNTDIDHPIILESVQYYNTYGELVKEYIESPLELAPMATTEVVVSRTDKQGGTGANFVVVWGAEESVYEPVVEALMISTAGQHGLSLLSPARVLEETP